MFEITCFEDLIRMAGERGCGISGVALAYECGLSGQGEEAVLAEMERRLEVMRESVSVSLRPDFRSVSGITGGDGYRVYRRSREDGAFSGDLLSQVLYRALCISETNAGMGRIVAAPTAGSCGILPACLLSLQEQRGLSHRQVAEGLLHASAVGLVIARNATVAGAEGGCQAECGSAAAMSASALVELLGGTPEMSGHACANALKSLMGLVCDPVAGLVEEPCIIRNASASAVAVAAAEMALAGVTSLIPVDEVIAAMKRVGGGLPESLRETAKGGLAVTPTGKRIAAELFETR